MSKTILIILLSSLLIVLSAFTIKSFYPNLFNSKPQTINTALIKKGATIELPVGLDHSAILAAGLSYSFVGKITDIKKDGENLKLTTDIVALDGLPEFIVTKDTNIVLVGPQVNQKKTMNDLKVGQKVRIFAYYGLKTTEWTINGVNIIPE